jgi:hypothetical protein
MIAGSEFRKRAGVQLSPADAGVDGAFMVGRIAPGFAATGAICIWPPRSGRHCNRPRKGGDVIHQKGPTRRGMAAADDGHRPEAALR